MIISSSGLEQSWLPNCNYYLFAVYCVISFCQSILTFKHFKDLGGFFFLPTAQILPVSRGNRDRCMSNQICNSHGSLYHCSANTILLKTSPRSIIWYQHNTCLYMRSALSSPLSSLKSIGHDLIMAWNALLFPSSVLLCMWFRQQAWLIAKQKKSVSRGGGF